MDLFRTKPISGLHSEAAASHELSKSLSPLNLVSLGIGAVIGAGIFVITGNAAASYAGPAIVISFIISGLMQTEFSGRADVHGGTFAHGFHAAEDFDGVGGVISVGGFAVLGFRVVFRVVFRVEEFGLQFFRGHSAPWR